MIYYEGHIGCDCQACCLRFTTSTLSKSSIGAKTTAWLGAKKAGWTKVGLNHYCPDCAKHAGIQNLEPKGGS